MTLIVKTIPAVLRFMETSLLCIARALPAQLSQGRVFFVHARSVAAATTQCRIGLSRCDINTCDSLSPESAACARSAREQVGTAVVVGPLPTAGRRASCGRQIRLPIKPVVTNADEVIEYHL
jgi:hypothetical protein